MGIPTEIGSLEASSSAALILLVTNDRNRAVQWMHSIQEAGPLCLWVQSADRIAGTVVDLPIRAAVVELAVSKVWDLVSNLNSHGASVVAIADNPQRRLAALDRGCGEALPADSSAEEIARAALRAWRSAGQIDGLRGEITAGPLYMDCTFRRAFFHGEQVCLGPAPFNLLGFLAKHPGQPFSTRELLAKVWHDPYKTEGTVWSTVKKLRRALHDHGHIVNRTGYGYCFVPEEPSEVRSAARQQSAAQAS